MMDHPSNREAFAELMNRPGYERYRAHGGDWGAMLSPELSRIDSDHVIGVHVNVTRTCTPGSRGPSTVPIGAAVFAENVARRFAERGNKIVHRPEFDRAGLRAPCPASVEAVRFRTVGLKPARRPPI